MIERTWRLMQGAALVGTLTLVEVDMFWTDCRFEPGPAWNHVHPYMEALGSAARRRDMAAVHTADEAIGSLGLALISADGDAAITEFLLRIDGEWARFRH